MQRTATSSSSLADQPTLGIYPSLAHSLLELRWLLCYLLLVLSSPVLKLLGQLPAYSWRTVTAGIWVPWLLAGLGWVVIAMLRAVERRREHQGVHAD